MAVNAGPLPLPVPVEAAGAANLAPARPAFAYSLLSQSSASSSSSRTIATAGEEPSGGTPTSVSCERADTGCCGAAGFVAAAAARARA